MRLEGNGSNRRARSSSSMGPLLSHNYSSSFLRITGIRSWNGLTASFALVVTIAKDLISSPLGLLYQAVPGLLLLGPGGDEANLVMTTFLPPSSMMAGTSWVGAMLYRDSISALLACRANLLKNSE